MNIKYKEGIWSDRVRRLDQFPYGWKSHLGYYLPDPAILNYQLAKLDLLEAITFQPWKYP